MKKYFFDEWKNKTEIEKRAIESFRKGLELILHTVPKDELVSVYATIKAIEEANARDLSQVSDVTIRNCIRPVFARAWLEQDSKMRNWFSTNYDQLLYNTSGNIPFPIINAMRRRFVKWANQQSYSFDKPIKQLVDEAARCVGLDTNDYNSYQEIWDALKKYN